MTESYFLENSHRILWVDTDNRQIISMKSRGFPQTPQDIMEKYNGCSVPQYTAYRRVKRLSQGYTEGGLRQIAQVQQGFTDPMHMEYFV